MKIKTKRLKNNAQSKCCNNYADEVYRLDGWDVDDWLCSQCFVKDLIEGDYNILVDRESKKWSK